MSELIAKNVPDSIEVTKNAKGYTWKIKLYYDKDVTDHDKIINKIEDIDKKLKENFEQ